MSPAGGDKPGLGGSGGGSGIGNGIGPGSGMTGENSGAGKSGTGRGSDPNARGGISPTPGPGGSGSAPTGTPAAPGVDVRGGSTVVTLPSFDSGNSNAPSLPGRSSVKGDPGPAITIVATSRSGGAFDFYGKLPGDNYTVYVDTDNRHRRNAIRRSRSDTRIPTPEHSPDPKAFAPISPQIFPTPAS